MYRLPYDRDMLLLLLCNKFVSRLQLLHNKPTHTYTHTHTLKLHIKIELTTAT